MACINRPFSKQSGATCWFHAIMNGFVTSKYGQIIMYKALAKYIDENIQTKKQYEDFISSDLTCVRPGKLHSKFNFYKWFYHWLILGIQGNRNTRIVMRNLVLSKRNTNANTHQLPSQGLFDVLGRMEIHDYAVIDLHSGKIHKTYPDPSFIVYAISKIDWNNPLGGFGSYLPAQVDIEGRSFRLDHASFGEQFSNGGEHSSHAITGIRCMRDGSPMIIDSNSSLLYPCDWSKPDNITRCEAYVEECQKLYHSPPTSPIVLFVIYTNVRMSANNFNRNVNNIGPQKILNRLNRAMNTSG